VIENLTWIKVK